MNNLPLIFASAIPESDLLHFSKHTLQYVSLGIMAVVYTLRIICFLSFKAGGERQAPTGSPSTTRTRGVLYSLANIAMPWAMESTRNKPFLYAQFVVFHLGVIRIIRRVVSPYMRAISSPDDYVSLVLLTVWFLSAIVAAPNDASGGEGYLLAFFILTAFFLIYVPFSKISHYLYYPFTRYYFGKTMGHRGTFPPLRG